MTRKWTSTTSLIRAEIMSVSRGDIVPGRLPVQRSNGQQSPARPCRPGGRSQCRITDTILASISRSTHRASATQLFIDISAPEGGGTGLRQNSMIQCENLLTYDQRLVITKIGRTLRPTVGQDRELPQGGPGFGLGERFVEHNTLISTLILRGPDGTLAQTVGDVGRRVDGRVSDRASRATR